MGDMNGAFTKIDEVLKGLMIILELQSTATGASGISASSSVVIRTLYKRQRRRSIKQEKHYNMH